MRIIKYKNKQILQFVRGETPGPPNCADSMREELYSRFKGIDGPAYTYAKASESELTIGKISSFMFHSGLFDKNFRLTMSCTSALSFNAG